MNNILKAPFVDGHLRIVLADGEVQIYGTQEGIQRLADLCKVLIDKSAQAHIHLEDYELLTKDSLKAVIAKFENN